MADPVASPSDLATLLGEAVVDERAALALRLAQDKCELFLKPLPITNEARGVVLDIALRAYANITSAHSVGVGTGQVSFGAQNTRSAIGGLYLSRANKAELRLIAGGGGAFSVNLLPANYTPSVPPWDWSSTGQIIGESGIL